MMDRPPLTKRQREILDFFEAYSEEKGISPTLEEIAQELGVNKVTVFGHVAELERKGVLSRSRRGISRGLQIVPTVTTSLRLQILGIVAAGRPIEAIEDPQELDLRDLLPNDKDVFGLRVLGDSMIEDSICDSDLVLVERRQTARDGEIVVAVLESGEATLKRIYHERGRIRLQPSNASMSPIYVDQVEIRGVVLSVVRQF